MVDIYKVFEVVDFLVESVWGDMKDVILGYVYSDFSIEFVVLEVNKKYNYIIDLYGVVGYLVLNEYQKSNFNI